MNAIEFIKERQRLCEMHICCSECPASDSNNACRVSVASEEEASRQVELVEDWSAAHPRKTRQSELLKQYPETALDENGVISICPNALFLAYRNSNGGCNNPDSTCPDCRREFWSKEVE